ncbi:UDP-glycosyltransferase/glycogen phosphorylase, partial [Haematococcus lacustris]
MLKDPIEYARLKTEQLKATRQKQDQEAQEEAKAAAVLQEQLHGFQLWRQQRKELKASIEQAAAKEDKQYGAALSKYVAYKAQTELARLGEREAVLFSAMMQLPALLAAVSPSVAHTLSHRFGRLSLLVPNGIDTGQWMGALHDPGPGLAPAPLPHPDPASEARPGQPQYRVLLVGHPGLAIKDFPTALAVLQSVSQALGRLHVTWVCQAEPPPAALDWCGPSVTWKLEVTPPQDALPALFRGHQALLMTSRSEGWSLPVLEAMASGVPPVITACGGPEAFALHEHNCLLAQ